MARPLWHFLVAAALTATLLLPGGTRAEESDPPGPPGDAPPVAEKRPLGDQPGILPRTPAAEAPPFPVLQPMSPQCEVPAADIASPAPLPHVAASLTERKPLRILAIGSSSTQGIGASARSRNYPAQLGDILQRALRGVDVEIVNRGVGGEVAATTAERLRSEVAVSRPDLVLWQLGTNDALARVPIDEFEGVVRSTLAWLKTNGIDVVLVGLQYTAKLARDANYVAIRDALFKIASEERILYVRRYNAMQFIERARNTNLMSPDDLHPNDLGYRCMAEHVAQAVIANLYIRRFRPATN